MIGVQITQLYTFVKTPWMYTWDLYISVYVNFISVTWERETKYIKQWLLRAPYIQHPCIRTFLPCHPATLQNLGTVFSKEHQKQPATHCFPFLESSLSPLHRDSWGSWSQNNGAWIKEAGACGFCRPRSLLSSSLATSLPRTKSRKVKPASTPSHKSTLSEVRKEAWREPAHKSKLGLPRLLCKSFEIHLGNDSSSVIPY